MTEFVEEYTDLTRWRLEVDQGRQTWAYIEDDAEHDRWKQTDVERYWLGLPLEV
jgi:lanosterol synthase